MPASVQAAKFYNLDNSVELELDLRPSPARSPVKLLRDIRTSDDVFDAVAAYPVRSPTYYHSTPKDLADSTICICNRLKPPPRRASDKAASMQLMSPPRLSLPGFVPSPGPSPSSNPVASPDTNFATPTTAAAAAAAAAAGFHPASPSPCSGTQQQRQLLQRHHPSENSSNAAPAAPPPAVVLPSAASVHWSHGVGTADGSCTGDPQQQQRLPPPPTTDDGETEPSRGRGGGGAAGPSTATSRKLGVRIPKGGQNAAAAPPGADAEAAGGSSDDDDDDFSSSPLRSAGEDSCPSPSVQLNLGRNRLRGPSRLPGLEGLGLALGQLAGSLRSRRRTEGLDGGGLASGGGGGASGEAATAGQADVSGRCAEAYRRLQEERERCLRLSAKAGRRLERDSRKARARAAAQMQRDPP
ncbi:hypothetical protein PLESTB_000651600 [Pleodorina starrii]|uniref:Uncharacterized protein n=1 Tax=Pleodorina starrii TaxID=330485 RepID=A0A9W6F1S8_9CHLO|nr:hypothetical protein PLESTM_001312800 [Pleodorina starrii]GLC52635.1 hypothetical protein PLESTB_000651600 [Pleodorina starrii]GLC71641.1 hypothetical protein PLESTF_001144300 [Pleodorina starrii]